MSPNMLFRWIALGIMHSSFSKISALYVESLKEKAQEGAKIASSVAVASGIGEGIGVCITIAYGALMGHSLEVIPGIVMMEVVCSIENITILVLMRKVYR